MTFREALFAGVLLISGAAITYGASLLFPTGAEWIVGGAAFAGISFLVLSE